MIDTHAHLDFKDFDEDREEVISRSFDGGVKKIVNIGVDLERSRKSIEMAEKHPGIFASAGIHPEYFRDNEPGNDRQRIVFDDLKELAKHKKVVAIGECGLDYFSHTNESVSDEQKENQRKVFFAQINLAQEFQLPVIVHCREAWSDLFEIVKSQIQNPNIQINPKSKIQKKINMPNTMFVLHCYSGDKNDTQNFLELPNVFFSFSGNITYPKPIERAEKLAEAVRMIPLDRIMLDSDSPFLAPQMMRGKRNEPMNIRFIAKKIAEIKKISEEEVEKTTDLNAINFFGIG